jgi:ankyrin repeat protein
LTSPWEGTLTSLQWIKSDVRRFQQVQESANRALIALSKHGPRELDQTEAMHVLLDQCAANVECRDEQSGRTPLIWAVKWCHENVVKLLARRGAKTDVADREGRTVQYWARKTQDEKITCFVCRRV